MWCTVWESIDFILERGTGSCNHRKRKLSGISFGVRGEIITISCGQFGGFISPLCP